MVTQNEEKSKGRGRGKSGDRGRIFKDIEIGDSIRDSTSKLKSLIIPNSIIYQYIIRLPR
jgi:hypothetical protein